MERSPQVRYVSDNLLRKSLLLAACLAPLALYALQTAPSAQISAQQAPSPPRIPRQQRAITSAIQGMVQTTDGVVVAGVPIVLTTADGKSIPPVLTSGDGIFRRVGIPPGVYTLSIHSPNYADFSKQNVQLNAGDVLTVEIKLQQTTSPYGNTAIVHTPGAAPSEPAYRELNRRNPNGEPVGTEIPLVPDSVIMQPRPDRWDIGVPNQGNTPSYRRYNSLNQEAPYKFGRWYDPFNRNTLKADYPILGQQTFVNFSGVSFTAFDARRLPTPSGVDARNPGSAVFFGKGGQVFLDQTFRLTVDLFHGDTSFRPADWRIKITPAFNINYLGTQERGIVNRDPRNGTDRTDGHVGLQEAFFEYKIKDVGPNFDFVSVRAGIQQFSSDFRGFIFADEQPGVRLFGNLHSNRIQYNAAYFNLLEKDTNSGLNTFQLRNQQVVVANVYIQDFGFKGYTTEFSYHYNDDNGDGLHYDNNGFLERPAPIGVITPHSIRSHYIGWTSDGHIGRFNIDHAFYQVLGHDTLNPLAGKRVDINAQFAALEVSYDRDWIRYRISALYASGDRNTTDRTARGFDSIDDSQTFAGGIFSFFDREGIRLTGTGVALTAPGSFLPDLRASKEEGQSNFVNPGVGLVNAAVDFDITPKLRGFTNVSQLRFIHTEPLQQLLFQGRVRSSLGTDFAIGATYRPQLSENISFTTGVTALAPGRGLRDIYQSKTLVSAFGLLRFQF